MILKNLPAVAAPISLLGFMVINENEELGEVIEVIEQPHQILCKIMLNGKEAFIPVHEDSLEKIDKKNRKLFLNLAGGIAGYLSRCLINENVNLHIILCKSQPQILLLISISILFLFPWSS